MTLQQRRAEYLRMTRFSSSLRCTAGQGTGTDSRPGGSGQPRRRGHACFSQPHRRTSFSFTSSSSSRSHSRSLKMKMRIILVLCILIANSVVQVSSQGVKNIEHATGFLEQLWEKIKHQKSKEKVAALDQLRRKKQQSVSSGGHQRGRRRDLFEHAVQSHYARYMSEKEKLEYPWAEGHNTDAHNVDPAANGNSDGDDDMIFEAENGCLWYNEGSTSYWTYRWCPGESMVQVRMTRSEDDKTWHRETEHSMGSLMPDDKTNSYLSFWKKSLKLVAHDTLRETGMEFFKNGDNCAFTTKSAGEPKKRRAVVVIETCPSHMATKRILRVEEPLACDYVMHACFPEPRKEQQAAKGTEAADEESRSVKTSATSESIIDHQKDEKKTKESSVNAVASASHSRDLEQVVNNYLSLPDSSQAADPTTSLHISFPPFPPSRIEENRKLIRNMFQHSYDSYMYHAFPASEVKPLSCKPGTFHLVRLPALTLIDSLDTLIVMQNFTEFARGVERIRDLHQAILETGGLFAVNQNVSVFETNIRVLGGLLSAHQLAVAYMDNQVLERDVWNDHGQIWIGEPWPETNTGEHQGVDGTIDDSLTCPVEPICENTAVDGASFSLQRRNQPFQYRAGLEQCINNSTRWTRQTKKYWKYDGILLDLALDLGKRMLPAFDTKTGIPYGTVNLLYGIPPGETTVASLAGGGTLSLEMELLSRLTGDESFGKAAKLASRALWLRRSPDLNLLGKHIDVNRGDWTETLSGIGSNSDSFYEYLIKHYLLFPEDEDFWTMLVSVYNGVYNGTRLGEWYADVDMNFGIQSGGSRRILESLMAFYPGMQVLLGELSPAARSLNSFFIVREYLGFLPERFNYAQWQVDGIGAGHHPLRPELLESCYFLHKATSGLGNMRQNCSNASSTGWLWAADFSLHAIHEVAYAKCGYATIKGVSPSTTGSFPKEDGGDGDTRPPLSNEMPSFFLSETLKYLFLMFDDNNILHTDTEREWVFTTEAHPIHHVAASTPAKSVKTQSKKDVEVLDELEAVKSRLEYRLIHRLQKRKGTVRSEWRAWAAAAAARKEAGPEKWTQETPSLKYSNHLTHSEEDTFQRKVFAQQTSDPSGTPNPESFELPFLGPLHPSMKEPNSTEGGDNLAHVGFEYQGLGNGASLMKSCPNFHNSALLWVRALNGGALDYSDTYISSASNDVSSHAGASIVSALDAAAHYGTGLYSGTPWEGRDQTCSLSMKEQKSSSSPKPALGTERVTVAGLGDFDIALFEDGRGFYARLLDKDESISVTFNPEIDSQFAMVYLKSPVVQDKEPENAEAGLEAEPASSARSNWKSMFLGSSESPGTGEKRQMYDRQVAFTDAKSGTFICSISVVKKVILQLDTGDRNVAVDNEILLGQFPCAPALFGQTQISHLMESGGLDMEGEIRAPPTSDPLCCDEVGSVLDQDESTIQLAMRGKCPFESKAINMGHAQVVVIVNSVAEELFLMSGSGESTEDVDAPPTVMIAGDDGETIQRLIKDHSIPPLNLAGDGKVAASVMARVRLSPQDGEIADGKIVPSGEKGGKIDWPFVVSQPNQIRVFAPSGWGVQAMGTSSMIPLAEKTPQWQLFLLTHET